jgi:Ca2+-binding RTX toxin-like protein
MSAIVRTCQPVRRRFGVITAIIVAALAGVAALPAAASAATVEVPQDIVVAYRAAPGEINSVQVSTTADGRTRIEDEVPIVAGLGCGNVAPNAVLCSGRRAVEVSLGDRNDGLSSTAEVGVRLDGGPGDDRLTAGHGSVPSGVFFIGGPDIDRVDYTGATEPVSVHTDGASFDGRQGKDHDNIRADVEEIVGSRFADVLSGDTGSESFHGRGGGDLVLAGGGDDFFFAEDSPDGPDKISGGAGVDLVSYTLRKTSVNVTPDAGGANDGAPNERDEVIQAEVIQGGAGSDVLDAALSPALGYTLLGGAGTDLLTGSDGEDRLVGGLGRDELRGLLRPDVLDSRDGVAEELLCGDGPGDVALLDPPPSNGLSFPGARDRPIGCESHPGAIVGTAHIDRVTFAGDTVALRVSWTHPRRWSELRRITVELRDQYRVVGRRSFTPHGGKGRRVSARLRIRIPDAQAGDVLSAKIRAVDRRGRRQVARHPAAVGL